MRCSKVVITFPDSVTGTVGAAVSFGTISNAGFPFVAILTDPKDFGIRRREDLRRF